MIFKKKKKIIVERENQNIQNIPLEYTFFESCSNVYVDVFKKTCNNEYITYSKLVRATRNVSFPWQRGDAAPRARGKRKCRTATRGRARRSFEPF